MISLRKVYLKAFKFGKGNYRQRDQGFPTARVITSSKKPNITIEDGYSDRVEKNAFWTFGKMKIGLELFKK